MQRKLFLSLLVTVWLGGVLCTENVEKKENRTVTGRELGYGELIGCIRLRDTGCFLDVAEDIMDNKKMSLLAEADRIAAQRGRAEGEEESETPTQLSNTIKQLVNELTDMVVHGIGGLFRDAKDDDEEEESTDTNVAEKDDEKNDDEEEDSSRAVEGRKKKKKKIHKLIALIKLLILGAVLAVKLIILLKILSFHLQVKFLMIAFAGLIINAARFYLDLKKKHDPQKVIYYEHAQHQHHYEGGEDDWSSGPSESYWGRSYEEEDGKTAHDIAYAKQKPIAYKYDKADSDKSSSWWG
ncbi:hypothetical protein WA026_023047 [Henosepilachna vigintioctopunctata]|uniref:Osiris 9 n=1 Tax=Henosepilachna vigintioctopunctata TaxID=420089 RepID=A0AAW1VDR9_9CUCU